MLRRYRVLLVLAGLMVLLSAARHDPEGPARLLPLPRPLGRHDRVHGRGRSLARRASGGIAQRLTTHPEEESRPAISPDGKTVAYSATYEGPTEVYTLPLDGGVPVRQTWGATAPRRRLDADRRGALRHAPVLDAAEHAARARSTRRPACARIVPLAQATDGAFDATGRTLFFTRLAFQGSHTRRYKGGTAQNLWRFADGRRRRRRR